MSCHSHPRNNAVGVLLCSTVLAGICVTASAQSQPQPSDATQTQPAQSTPTQDQTQPAQNQAQAQPQQTQAQPSQGEAAPSQPAGSAGANAGVVAAGLHSTNAAPNQRRLRQAEDAYLAGAKRLQRDDLDAAESEFKRALALDPENRDYAIAISVTRQHRVTELVQRAGKARQAGETGRAETLLAEARVLDPENPIVTEHSGIGLAAGGQGLGQTPGQQSAGRAEDAARATDAGQMANRALLLAGAKASEPWRIEAPQLAGAIQLAPATTRKTFHLRGESEQVLQSVAGEYGIRTVFDDSIRRKEVRFDLEDAPYEEAIGILSRMTEVFVVPLDATSVLVARDDADSRQRLERQMEETIYLPTATVEQINDLANVMKNVFDVKQATVETGLSCIIVRAPQETFAAMNRTIEDLIDAPAEVMVEVKLYEVDTTRMTNAGATIPTTAGIYNVEEAAASLVSANQALVQQAIAQGFITSATSNIDIALALIGSGLVSSPMLSSTIGFFGKGLTMTGITASTNTAFNLGLNSTDTSALDDVQIRVGDRQPATFREGTRYPITTSKYTTGLSTAASALSNATINGVSVASLLSQYAGGTSTTIPQVTYEDLGVTLKAVPTIQKAGRISLGLDLKIEALAGGSSNGIPVLVSRQLVSDVTVADGESAMLVSFVSKNETAALTGIPGLSELPGFQMPIAENLEKDTNQLVVVVTPHVVRRRSDTFAGPRILVRAEPTQQ